METTFLWYYTLSFLSLASAGRKQLLLKFLPWYQRFHFQFSSALVKRDTISELTDIGNSIGNSIKDMVGLETNKDIIDDIKDIDVRN